MLAEIVSITLAANTWWVQSGGSVAGNGSQGNPFATIGQGLTAASPGDTVMVLPGTYVENLSVSTDGITLKAQDAGTVVLDGTDGGSTYAGLEILGVNWVIDGITFRGGGFRSLVVSPTSCPADGGLELVRVRTEGFPVPSSGACDAGSVGDPNSYSIEISCLTDVWVHDSTLLGNPCTANLSLNNVGGGHVLVERNEVSGAHWTPIDVDGADAGVVRSNFVHGPCCDGQIGGITQNTAGIFVESSRNVTVEHNLVVQTGDWGIGAYDQGNLLANEQVDVRDNTIVGAALSGVQFNAVDGRARSNLVSQVTCIPGSCPLSCKDPAAVIVENSEGGSNPTIEVGWNLFDGTTAPYCVSTGSFVDAGPVILAPAGFVDAGGANFHLTAGSAAIGMGDPSTPAGIDFDGAPVPTLLPDGGVRFDIGALQYQSPVPDAGLADAGSTDGGGGTDAGGSKDAGASDGGTPDAGFARADGGSGSAGSFGVSCGCETTEPGVFTALLALILARCRFARRR